MSLLTRFTGLRSWLSSLSSASPQSCRSCPSETMSSWSVEKNVLANQSAEERRKGYLVKSYVTLDEIPSWTLSGRSLPAPLERDRDAFKDFELREDLNGVLAPKISVWPGDITKLEIDAIVNAANKALLGGGGVDGAIHRAAGPNLLAECKEVGGCPTGQARMTGGYLLPARHVIHTVGPTDKSHSSLVNCYKSCFALMRANELKSVAFPCIGTGVYNFPNVEAAHIACSEARAYLEEDHLEHGSSCERVIFCLFEQKDIEIYKSVAQLYFPLEK